MENLIKSIILAIAPKKLLAKFLPEIISSVITYLLKWTINKYPGKTQETILKIKLLAKAIENTAIRAEDWVFTESEFEESKKEFKKLLTK